MDNKDKAAKPKVDKALIDKKIEGKEKSLHNKKLIKK